MAIQRRTFLPIPSHRSVAACLAFFLLAVWAAPAPAQEPSEPPPSPIASVAVYRDLWQGGEYARALVIVESMLGDRKPGFAAIALFTDRARLLFELGRVDEAIGLMEAVAARYPDPAYTVPLALDYRYRGRMDEYAQALRIAHSQAQGEIQSISPRDTALAVARLMELEGENPRQILNTYFKLWGEMFPNDPTIPVGAGDLAVRKNSFDVAAEYYSRALSLDPDNQDALAGLAECYWKSADPRLDEPLNALIERNPRHPRALALRIEQQLDLGRPDPALELIDARLSINPSDLHFLSLKAAAQFLRDDPTATSRTQTRVLQFNPHRSEVFRVPARIASRHYRFQEAAGWLRRALLVDPDDHAARADLALNLLRLGEQAEGRQHLEAAFKADPFNVRAYNLLEVLDSIDTFHTLSHGPFLVQLPEHEARVLDREILATLDRAFDRYTAKYKTELATPVLVQMFDDHDEFMVRSIGLPGNTGLLGICFGRLVTLDSPRARPPATLNWRSVLWHEFVHVITLQKTHNRIPRWLSEGISVYEETQESPAWGQRLDPRYKPLLASMAWPALADLEVFFITPESSTHLMLGYFLAGEFVAFYVAEFGDRALVDSLDRIAAGDAADLALVAAAGVTPGDLDERFAAFLEKRCASLQNLPDIPSDDAATTETFVQFAAGWTRVSSPFTDALTAGAQAAERKDWPAAERAFIAANDLYPDYLEPDAPLRQLAAVYDAQGDRNQFKATLERIVAADGTAFAECRRLAAFCLEDGDGPGATHAAALAFDIDPFSVANLRDWRAGLVLQGDPQQELTLLSSLAWLDRGHQVDHRLARAALLTQTGDRDAAKNETIALLEEMPHYWEAQKLLLKIVEDDDATTPALPPAREQ